MAKVDVVNLKNEKVGSLDLPDAVFSQKVNGPLVLQVIKAQLAAKRQGTASSKTKGLIRGGGKKPFKQKGTGNARQGSSRSPLMPGGGSAFGPQPRDYTQNTPREMLKGALRSVLSDKLASSHLVVVDKFDIKEPKTKSLEKILREKFSLEKTLLVDLKNKNLSLSARNLPKVNYLAVESVNTYDLVKHEWLIISQDSIMALSKRLETR